MVRRQRDGKAGSAWTGGCRSGGRCLILPSHGAPDCTIVVKIATGAPTGLPHQDIAKTTVFETPAGAHPGTPEMRLETYVSK